MFSDLLPFFVVITAGLLFSEIFKKLHLPLVVALILAGVIVGPEGFGLVETSPILDFLGRIGIIFLMFIAGLEVKAMSFWQNRKTISPLFFLNSLIPFLTGLGIAWYFNYDISASILLGAVFLSSSGAVIIPILESRGLMSNKLGQTIVSNAILEDIAGLLILSVLLQAVIPTNDIPIILFYGLILLVVFVARLIIPILQRYFKNYHSEGESRLFEEELRVVFTVLIGVVVLFELIGLHDIIAGFFTGLLLSNIVQTHALKEKIRAIGYSFFIPIFFVLAGTQINLSFLSGGKDLILIVVVVFGSMLVKFGSGWLGARAGGFSANNSIFIGSVTMAQLFTTLATAFAGLETGLFDEVLVTAIIVLALVSTLVSNLLAEWLKTDMILEKES